MAEHLYIGIDIGKRKHVACFISISLLARHGKYKACPTLEFPNLRTGFEQFLATVKEYAPRMKQISVLMERTGHYGHSIEQYLQEQGMTLYRIQAQFRYSRTKTDKDDAQSLAVMLFSQVELKSPVIDKKHQAVRLIAPSPVARELRVLVRRRHELVRDIVRAENKLTAICDELFPEFTQVFISPNSPSALAFRQKYPTAESVAQASPEDLFAACIHSYPGRKRLARLKELANTSIGTKDDYRRRSLIIEQEQLIAAWYLYQEHVMQLEAEIERIVPTSREGRILLSLIGIGPVQAATIIATVGNIANFETVGELRLSMGWGIRRSQTGTTYDTSKQDKGGSSLMKTMFYLAAMTALRYDPGWRRLYDRLIAAGKTRAIGRIAGQLVRVIFFLLKRDAALLASLEPGQTPPEPELYDPMKHHVAHW